MKKLLEYLFGNILFGISFFFPKSPKIWVFGSWGGNAFADNPKYLYRHVTSHHADIKSVWLTRNTDVFNKLRSQNYNVYFANSIKGIWYSCRAKVGITSHGMIDLNRFAVARMKIVQTWHGIPMKPILLSDPKKDAILKRKKLLLLSTLFPFLKKDLCYSENIVICSSTEYVSNILKKCFGESSPIKNVGFPRIDGLFAPHPTSELTLQIIQFKEAGKSIGIYMPTYRREGEFDIIKYLIDNMCKIEKDLIKNNKVLYLKIHPFEYFKIKSCINSSCIYLLSDQEIDSDIYSILSSFDFLISDFSSIVFDYLVLLRPTYLLVPDRDSYITSNGDFVYDYTNIGIPVSTSWNNLLTNLSKPFDDLSNEDINVISNRYHEHYDDNNSRRLCDYIRSNI